MDLLVAGSAGPNAARIMPKVHDMWVNSLAALLGALAAIQSVRCRYFVRWLVCMRSVHLAGAKAGTTVCAMIITLVLYY